MTEGSKKAAAAVRSMKGRLRITRVVCSRTVGDVRVELTGGLISSSGFGFYTADEGEPLTLREAQLATYILGMNADVLAHERAVAAGVIRPDFGQQAVKAIETNYASLILQHVGDPKE